MSANSSIPKLQRDQGYREKWFYQEKKGPNYPRNLSRPYSINFRGQLQFVSRFVPPEKYFKLLQRLGCYG